MALDGHESEGQVRCAFTAALTTVYDVHFSEIAALQNEIKRQQNINEAQQKRIEELERHLHRMKCTLKSSKAKIRQQLCTYRKLKQLLEEHNIPIPHQEKQSTPSVLSDDSTTSDKVSTSQLSSKRGVVDEDNTGISQESPNAGHTKHGTCSQHDCYAARASINLSSATIDLSTSSSEETENEDEDDVIVVEEDPNLEMQGHRNKLGSQARESSSIMEEVQQQHDLNTGSTTHLQEENSAQSKRKLPDLKGQLRLHASEGPTKIKYKDICKHDGATAHTKLGDLSSGSPSSAPAQTELVAGHQDSSSPSPSLLCKPTSPWKSATQVQNTTSPVVPGGNECEIVTEIPLTDSQLSLDVSQTIPPSLELPPVSTPYTMPLRKRNHAEAFYDCPDEERSPPTPCSPLPEPKHPGCCDVTAEHTEAQHNVASPSVILPKTPGVRALSSMVPGNKAFFAGVQMNKKTHTVDDARTNDNDTTLLSVSTPTCTTTHTLLQGRTQEPNSNVTHLHSIKQSLEDNSQEHDASCPDQDEVVQGYSEQTCHAMELAAKAGLPLYRCDAVIRNRVDRSKLDGKECSECRAWYSGDDGLHHNRRDHLKHTCRHKHLYHRQDSDPRMWNISFPNTEEMEM